MTPIPPVTTTLINRPQSYHLQMSSLIRSFGLQKVLPHRVFYPDVELESFPVLVLMLTLLYNK